MPVRADEPPILCIEPGGHTARVHKVLFRVAAGRTELISVGDDKAIRIWDADTGRQIRTLRAQIDFGPSGYINAAALSPDGKTLAIAGYEKIMAPSLVRIFNLSTGQIDRVLSGAEATIGSLAFSPDGRLLAAGCAAQQDPLRIYDLSSGRSVALKGHRTDKNTGGVNAVAFSSQGLLASAGGDRTVRIWEVSATGGKSVQILSIDSEVRAVDWSPDGKTVAAGGDGGAVYAWSSTNWQRRQLGSVANAALCVAVNDSGLVVAGQGEKGRNDTSVRVWSVDGGERATFNDHKESVISVAFTPDGSRIASADFNGVIAIWAPGGGSGRRLAGAGNPVTAVAWARRAGDRVVAWSNSPDGTHNTAAAWDQTFNVQLARPGGAAAGGDWQGAVTDLNGLSLSAGKDDLSVIVTRNGRVDREIVLSKGEPPISFGGVKMTREQFPDQADKVISYTFTPDGKSVIIGSTFRLREYDLSGRQTREYLGHSSSIQAVAVSPDGQYLVSGSADQTLRIWPLKDAGRTVLPLLNHFATAAGDWIAWTPQGYYTASPTGDRYIGWQVNQGSAKAAKFYDAERFSKIFYRPDVIFRLLTAGTLPKALIAANADPSSPFKGAPAHDITQIADITPPEVSILSPADGAVVRQQDLQVEAQLTGAARQGVELRAVVAEAPAARDLGVENDSGPQANAGPQKLSVHLLPGRNTIRVFAVDTRNRTLGQVSERTVIYQPADAGRARYGTLYMLSIGVSNYRNAGPGIALLPAATLDATEMSKIYGGQKGKLFDETNILTLPEDVATKDKVMDSIKSLCTGRKPGDYVILFISGHGMPSQAGRDKKFDRPDAFRYFFAPVDFALTNWDNSGVDWQWILQQLQKLPCPVVLFIDTCHSGGVGIEFMTGFNPLNETIRGAKDRGIYAITSCLPDETSLEDVDKWGHGAFTKGIIAALSEGLAPHDSDGIVSFDHAAVSIRDYVKNLVRPDKQNPKSYSPPGAPDDLPIFLRR
jgi:WD40 repeat protein